jgi:ubiquinone/menaquinone biosynthesis C-methylase UbiE
MAKQGEIDYLRAIGEAGVRHAADKPFSDEDCGAFLMELGAIMYLLPPPPARLLDLGCGTGWTSCFLARRGYQVTGQDIAADMIAQAERNRQRYQVEGVRFVACDYEALTFNGAFDCAIFFDSLHHAVSEEDALRGAYRALRPGGCCVTSEPGLGHARRPHSVEAVRRFNVTEKDMPPRRIIRAARAVGFRRWRVYPRMKPVSACLYGASEHSFFRMFSRLPGVLRTLALVSFATVGKRISGIVRLVK